MHWWVGTFPGIWLWNAALGLNSLEVRRGGDAEKVVVAAVHVKVEPG